MRNSLLCIALVFCALTVHARGGIVHPLPNEPHLWELFVADWSIYAFLSCICFFVIGRALLLSVTKHFWGWSLFIHAAIALLFCVTTASYRVTGFAALFSWWIITTLVMLFISMIGGVVVSGLASLGNPKASEPSATQ